MTSTTKQENTRISDKLAVDAIELQTLLSCGRHTAEKIGMKAEARIKIGKRVLWNVGRLRDYLDSISDGDK